MTAKKKARSVFWEKVVPTYLYNEDYGRMNGKLFTDEQECLEALASDVFWPCWTGPRGEVTKWAQEKLGIVPESTIVSYNYPEDKKKDPPAKIIRKPRSYPKGK